MAEFMEELLVVDARSDDECGASDLSAVRDVVENILLYESVDCVGY